MKMLFAVAVMAFVPLQSWSRDFLGELERKEEERKYSAQTVELFNRVKDSIVIITGNRSSGTGFIAEMDGRKWLVTNEHVIRNQVKIRAKTLSGKSLAPTGTVDVARNRDLVRYEIDDSFAALKLTSTAPNIEDRVWVFGNSDGGGVATSIIGKILGLGADRVEVSAPFVSGNSGSAIVNSKAEIVAVATYAEINSNYRNWVNIGTRFNEVRRYGIRIDGVEWEKGGFARYLQDAKNLAMGGEIVAGINMICFGEKGSGFSPVSVLTQSQMKCIRRDKKLNGLLTKIKSADEKYIKRQNEYQKRYKFSRDYRNKGKMECLTPEQLNKLRSDVDNLNLNRITERYNALELSVKALRNCRCECVLVEKRQKELLDLQEELLHLFAKKYHIAN